MSKNTRGKKARQSNQKKKNWLYNIILVVAFCVLVVSGYRLYSINAEYNKGKAEYEAIQKEVIKKPKKVEIKKEEKEEKPSPRMGIDFKTLKAKNKDTVAWINFEEPAVINYPVVYNGNNTTYLTKTFSSNKNVLGAIFVDAENNPDFNDQNTILYGHNMNNKTMFAHLLDYKDKNFWQKYPYFYIYTTDGRELQYKIYSAGIVKETDFSFQTHFKSPQEFEDFVGHTKHMSAYQTDVAVTGESKIVTLSTCTNVKEDERFLVRGVLVRTLQ